MIPAHDLWNKALCAQTGDELFFPDRGESGAEGKRICAMCDVRTACLEWALAQPAAHDEYGIYGGLAPRERAAIRKQRKEAA